MAFDVVVKIRTRQWLLLYWFLKPEMNFACCSFSFVVLIFGILFIRNGSESGSARKKKIESVFRARKGPENSNNAVMRSLRNGRCKSNIILKTTWTYLFHDFKTYESIIVFGDLFPFALISFPPEPCSPTNTQQLDGVCLSKLVIIL